MTPLVIAELVLRYGLPFAQQIVKWHAEKKQVVTPEDFEALIKLAQYRSSDALTEAGVAIVDGKVVKTG